MEKKLIDFREQQKASWNKFSPGWKKWDDLNMEFLQPVGDAIIKFIDPKGDDYILDIASGTGEPGLTIAALLDSGKVVMTDLSDEMLQIAKDNAEKRGIRNIEVLNCDVSELPFKDNTFDSISCRFGFMFFPDMLLAAKEMVRVLKPGGNIATSVWNVPDKNDWVMAILGRVNSTMGLPNIVAGSPGMFRCAEDGLVRDVFKQAGIKDVQQNEITWKRNFESTDVYWSMMTEVVSLIVNALGNADENQKAAIKENVYNEFSRRYSDGKVVLDSSAYVISGIK